MKYERIWKKKISFFRSNPEFIKLFLGQTISAFGDWFNLIAVLSTLKLLTNDGWIVGVFWIVKLFPRTFSNIISGPIIEKLDKRKCLILLDVLSAFATVGLIFTNTNNLLIIFISLILLKNFFTSMFLPVRMALIPPLLQKKEDILEANSIMSFAYYATLLFATALGGFFVNVVGFNGVIIFDTLSFIVSAICIYRIKNTSVEIKQTEQKTSFIKTYIKDLSCGIKYLKEHALVLQNVICKFWVTSQ